MLHRFADAEHCYRDAITIARELDTPAEVCAVLRRQGLLHLAQNRYREALDCWVQALALDQRLGHPARKDLQDKVDALVAQQHLEEAYAEFSKQHGLG